MDTSSPAYGLWSLVIINSAVFIIFAFSFARPRTKRDWRSFGAFSAFLVALFTEMYGFPLTVYLLSGWLSSRYPGIDPFSHNNGQEEKKQAPQTRSFPVTPVQPVRSDATGERMYASGQATLTDTTDGVRVDIWVQNLPGGQDGGYKALIRGGRCSKEWPDPPEQAELTRVVIGTDGIARSSTFFLARTLTNLSQAAIR